MSIEHESDSKSEIVRENESEEEEEEEEEELRRVQPWKKQITVRGVMASVVIGSIFSVIAMKMNLTTGITPNLNVSAALLAFVFMRTWRKALAKLGIASSPFTKQENTMIQTCVVACYSIAVGGGFGSYLLGMNRKTFELSGGLSVVGNFPDSIKEPGIGWMIVFLFLVCFIGLFVLIPLRKILIIDYELTFPTGMATAVLINGFHSRGDRMAKKQVRGFFKTFSFSFLWGFFQWFYTAKENCGFSQFPTFGLQARKQTFYFDFSLTYVGTGMICPHVVNLSLLFGAVISYGTMWPLIRNLKGEWFPADVPESSMASLNGYRVFISIALLLGDGLYNFVKILRVTIINIHGRFKRQNLDTAAGVSIDRALIKFRKDEVFVRENIPLWVGAVGYIILSLISVAALPFVIPELKWYYVLLAYVFAPSLAFCNAYGVGLTDINMAYNYGKVGLFTIAAMSGKEHGVIAALAACGLFKSIINVACILMQDFKTGHLTLTSPRAMLLFFQKGICAYGNRCRYDHIKVSRLDSSTATCREPIPDGPFYPSTSPACEVNLADRPICSFAAAGECPYGAGCRHVHGDLCPTCKKHCLHPLRAREREEHVRICERRQKQVDALRHSQEIECSVCLESILSKPTAAERKFGILSECDHPFCVSCIRNWRASSSDANSALRSCPMCRKLSYFVIPSVVWYSSKEEKQEIVDSYKAKLRSIDCKHFDFGSGACPFGTSCFYKHAYRDGRLEEVVLRHLGAEDGDTVIAKDIRLSEFLSNLRL